MTAHYPVEPQILSDEALHDGFELFHTGTAGGMACGSCHLEGHEDGRTWTFVGQGPVRTQGLAGVVGTDPFHWQGDLDSLGDLMLEVHTRRMGSSSELQGDEAAAALARFLEGVRPLQPTNRASADQLRTGPRCSDGSSAAGATPCRRPPRATTWAPAGPSRLPRLAGLSMRLPLMHDGCAQTLRDRFDPHCGGTSHGSTANLSEAELDALVAYLGTL